jgi:hypothetical protein
MPSPDWLSWEFWARYSQVLYHFALILAGLIGIPLLYIRTVAANRSANAALEQAKTAAEQAKTAAERHEEQTASDRERRITESFAKAVEQLGNDKLETRLGGIYTLERIARESEREYWPIMETLTAFVRERVPWPPRQALINPFVQLQVTSGNEMGGERVPAVEQPKDATEQTRARIRPATDIQAVLTVLGRRVEEARKRDEAAGRYLDLAGTDLRGASLAGARLKGSFGLFPAKLTAGHRLVRILRHRMRGASRGLVVGPERGRRRIGTADLIAALAAFDFRSHLLPVFRTSPVPFARAVTHMLPPVNITARPPTPI